MPRKYLLLILVTASVLLFDQGSKVYIDQVMRPGQSLMVIKDFFNITYVRNPGAAFGFLAGVKKEVIRPVFLVISLGAVVGILLFYRTIPARDYLSQVGFSLILAGAIGNLIDRLWRHEVIDFLDLHWQNTYHWPAFNVADASITIGVG
ncbi:MAG: signal peptidase II, partial [Nitrospinota bacterium]